MSSLEKHTFYILTDLNPNVAHISVGGTVTVSYKEPGKPTQKVDIYVIELDRSRGIIRGTTVPKSSRQTVTHVEISVMDSDLRVV